MSATPTRTPARRRLALTPHLRPYPMLNLPTIRDDIHRADLMMDAMSQMKAVLQAVATLRAFGPEKADYSENNAGRARFDAAHTAHHKRIAALLAVVTELEVLGAAISGVPLAESTRVQDS